MNGRRSEMSQRTSDPDPAKQRASETTKWPRRHLAGVAAAEHRGTGQVMDGAG
jgi:hypothetical protein